MQEEQLYPECGQDERTSVYKSYCVFAPPFSKKKKEKNTQQASTEISYLFLAPEVPVSGRNKPTTPVLQPIHFQLQRKPLY